MKTIATLSNCFADTVWEYVHNEASLMLNRELDIARTRNTPCSQQMFIHEGRRRQSDPRPCAAPWKRSRGSREAFNGLRSASKRWQEPLQSILAQIACVSHQLDPCLWTHVGKGRALAYHVDDLLMVGTRQTIKKVLVELSKDLEIVASEVTSKLSSYLGRTPGTISESITSTSRICVTNTTRQRSRVRLDCVGGGVV